mgnify:CR=1 FL=1
MKIGLVPGAMKPYHAGHHYLTTQASLECDKVIILTSDKDREDISGNSMVKCWTDIIIPLLPENILVEFHVSPIRATYEIMEALSYEQSGDEIYIYGGLEDVKRFPQEKISVNHPGIVVVNVAARDLGLYNRGKGDSPNVKGEWVREAMRNNDDERFAEFLPSFLKPLAKQYLDTLKINEGRY